MKATRVIGAMLTVAALWLLVATPALARDRHRSRERSEYSQNRENGNGHRHGNKHRKKHHKIPELDPGVAGSAAVLLIGGTLALTGRRRLESEA